MPFKSQAQRAWMYANDPDMAKEWEDHTKKGKKLPKKVRKDLDDRMTRKDMGYDRS